MLPVRKEPSGAVARILIRIIGRLVSATWIDVPGIAISLLPGIAATAVRRTPGRPVRKNRAETG